MKKITITETGFNDQGETVGDNRYHIEVPEDDFTLDKLVDIYRAAYAREWGDDWQYDIRVLFKTEWHSTRMVMGICIDDSLWLNLAFDSDY